MCSTLSATFAQVSMCSLSIVCPHGLWSMHKCFRAAGSGSELRGGALCSGMCTCHFDACFSSVSLFLLIFLGIAMSPSARRSAQILCSTCVKNKVQPPSSRRDCNRSLSSDSSNENLNTCAAWPRWTSIANLSHHPVVNSLMLRTTASFTNKRRTKLDRQFIGDSGRKGCAIVFRWKVADGCSPGALWWAFGYHFDLDLRAGLRRELCHVHRSVTLRVALRNVAVFVDKHRDEEEDVSNEEVNFTSMLDVSFFCKAQIFSCMVSVPAPLRTDGPSGLSENLRQMRHKISDALAECDLSDWRW